MLMQAISASIQRRLIEIATAARRAAGTENAAIFILEDGTYEMTCCVGDGRIPFCPTPALHGLAADKAMFFASKVDRDPIISEVVDQSGIAFFASASFVAESASGHICVYDDDVRGLSGAQEYILQALASSVADKVDLAFLRSHVTRSTERLRLLESVVVNANDAVLITEAEPIDLPGPRIIFANAAFTRTTGFELTEILGQTPRILQGPGTSAAAREKIRAALASWKPVELELLNFKKDGTPFWVELSIVPVADDAGWWTHWVSVQRDVTERKQFEEIEVRARIAEAEKVAFVHRAFHDELTGLPNRAYFMDCLRAAMNRPRQRRNDRVAVLFMDLDRFKIVNDSLGHDFGDQLLIEIGRRLQKCVRAPGVLARMGGDEFTFLIHDDKGLRASIALAKRVLRVLSNPIRLNGHDIVASASLGICCMDGDDETAESVLRNADIAMYHAKGLGGTRYSVFNGCMHEQAISTMQTELELRSAIAHDELELYYQPLVALRDGRIYGFEALIRWNHAVRGLVSPIDFISIAEETGLIVPMGARILDAACRQLLAWEDQGLVGLNINVNVSGRQLFDKTFRDELKKAGTLLGRHVGQVEIEITESVLLGRTSIADELLQWIRSLGFRVAFDDFGTGFSSLSYLQHFTIDTLKIDGSFIAKLNQPANVEIVRMIVALGAALGIQVVAEGIEESYQREILLQCNAEFGQGYLFGKPVAVDQVPSLLGAAGRNVLAAWATTG